MGVRRREEALGLGARWSMAILGRGEAFSDEGVWNGMEMEMELEMKISEEKDVYDRYPSDYSSINK